MFKGALIAGVVLVGTVATVAVLSGGDDPVTVVRVIDGDTLDARVDGEDRRIRLLNVDTPEFGQAGAPDDCFAQEATDYLRSVLPEGQEITLEYDNERTDRYGRDLAGVFVGDALVNAEITREGFGIAVAFGSNHRFQPPVKEAESEAREQQRGIHALEEECLVSTQTETVAGQAAPLLAAAVVSMSQAEIDLHEKKLLTVLKKARSLRTLAGRPSEFESNAYEGYRDERKELDRLIKRLDDRATEVEERRQRIEQEAEAEHQHREQKRIDSEREAQREEERRAGETAEAERRAQERVAPARAPAPGPAAPQPSAPSGGGGGGGGDTYTGCRAYGGNYALTNIDQKGQRYAKIDCVSKIQIG